MNVSSVLFLSGRFDAHEISAFRERVLAERLTTSHLSIDLHEVTFIDSIALAELVKLHKELEEADGRLTLMKPSDPVRVILDVTGLASLFHVSIQQ